MDRVGSGARRTPDRARASSRTSGRCAGARALRRLALPARTARRTIGALATCSCKTSTSTSRPTRGWVARNRIPERVSPSFSSKRYPRSGSPRSSRERSCARICSCSRTRLGRRVDPELVGEDLAGALRKDAERVRLPPFPVEREHQLLPEPLPQRVLRQQAAPVPRSHCAADPVASSAPIRSSCASNRSSSSRAASASKDRSATSASAGPRHSDEGVVEGVDRHLGVDGQRLPRVAHERVEPAWRRRRADRRPGRSRGRALEQAFTQGLAEVAIRRSGACSAPCPGGSSPQTSSISVSAGTTWFGAPRGSRARRAASVRRETPGHPRRRPATGRADGTAPGDGTQACVRRARRHR